MTFTNVKTQLNKEFNCVANTLQYQQNIKDLYTQIATGQDAILNGAYQAVKNSLSPSGDSKFSPKWQAVIAGSETISGDIASFAGPPAKLALDSVFVMNDISMAFANDAGGNPLQGAETKFDALQQESVTAFAASLTNIGNLFDLILTDWGRLKTLGEPLLKGCSTDNTQYNAICWDSNLNGVVLESLDRALRREYMTQLMAPAYEMGLWTNVSEGHPPILSAADRPCRARW